MRMLPGYCKSGKTRSPMSGIYSCCLLGSISNLDFRGNFSPVHWLKQENNYLAPFLVSVSNDTVDGLT